MWLGETASRARGTYRCWPRASAAPHAHPPSSIASHMLHANIRVACHNPDRPGEFAREHRLNTGCTGGCMPPCTLDCTTAITPIRRRQAPHCVLARHSRTVRLAASGCTVASTGINKKGAAGSGALGRLVLCLAPGWPEPLAAFVAPHNRRICGHLRPPTDCRRERTVGGYPVGLHGSSSPRPGRRVRRMV